MRLLLVEDDCELSRQIRRWLNDAGHDCEICDRGAMVLPALQATAFDAIILDVGLPDLDGFAVIKRVREHGLKLPVIFLTARDDVTDRVRGLKAGGDDYVTKPFAVAELLARLEVLQRRAAGTVETTGPRRIGRWVLDPLRRRLRDGDETVELQPREFTLIEVLLANDGRVLTKRFLLENVWDIRFDPGTNVVDAMICRLRRKIDIPGQTSLIETVRGKGYVLHAVS